jgi:hypothetical protein
MVIKYRNTKEAFFAALLLAVNAPTDEKSKKVVKMATSLSTGLTKKEIKEMKRFAEIALALTNLNRI